MALSNSQYDEIMRDYDRQQLEDRRILDERRKAVYARVPRLQEIDAAVASSSVRKARLLLDGDTSALSSLKEELTALREERNRLLKENGYSLQYLDPVYRCLDCKDSGYIDGKKCHCFKQAIINTVYAQSNIQTILERENFDHFLLIIIPRMTSATPPVYPLWRLRNRRCSPVISLLTILIINRRTSFFTAVPESARHSSPTVSPKNY